MRLIKYIRARLQLLSEESVVPPSAILDLFLLDLVFSKFLCLFLIVPKQNTVLLYFI